MKKRGKVIYFGEEVDEYKVEIHKDTILINGHPLIPPYSVLEIAEESEFRLDNRTRKIVEESLSILDSRLSFEDNADRVAGYLKERGLTVRKGEFYGDIMVETDEGWGVTVLFNEEARVKMSKPSKERKEAIDAEEFLKEGLIIVDKGFISMIPEEEAEGILENLEEIYASKEDLPAKIKRIQNLLNIPEESARKLLMQHT